MSDSPNESFPFNLDDEDDLSVNSINSALMMSLEDKTLSGKKRIVVNRNEIYKQIHAGEDVCINNCYVTGFSITEYKHLYPSEEEFIEIKSFSARDCIFEPDYSKSPHKSKDLISADFSNAHFVDGKVDFSKSVFKGGSVNFSFC
jgi:hypothetical protein